MSYNKKTFLSVSGFVYATVLNTQTIIEVTITIVKVKVNGTM